MVNEPSVFESLRFYCIGRLKLRWKFVQDKWNAFWDYDNPYSRKKIKGKRTFRHVHPGKIQISLHIYVV